MSKQMIAIRISAWRLWAYSVRRLRVLTIGVVLLLLELLIPRGMSHWLLITVTVVITGKGVLDVFTPVHEDMRRAAALKSRPSPVGPLLHGYAGPYRDWPLIASNGEEAAHNPDLDAALAAGKEVRLTPDEDLWLPPGQHEEIRALIVPTLDFDESKVRLVDDLTSHTTSVKVRRTLYSAFLVTNRLAAYQYRESNNRRAALSFNDIGLNSDGLIPRFPLSDCSNHIGVDVLAISEGKLILQRQSRRNRLHGDKVLGSGSGSADWNDLRASGYELNSFVRLSMRREMTEELGLTQKEAPGLDDIRIVGFNRAASLGGKPQFCGIARLGPVKLRIRRQEALYVDEYLTDVRFDPDEGVSALHAALDRLESTYHDQLAFPLFVTVQLVRQWLNTDPAAPEWLGLHTQ